VIRRRCVGFSFLLRLWDKTDVWLRFRSSLCIYPVLPRSATSIRLLPVITFSHPYAHTWGIGLLLSRISHQPFRRCTTLNTLTLMASPRMFNAWATLQQRKRIALWTDSMGRASQMITGRCCGRIRLTDRCHMRFMVLFAWSKVRMVRYTQCWTNRIETYAAPILFSQL
jgi:hypothetical protein